MEIDTFCVAEGLLILAFCIKQQKALCDHL